YERLLATVPAAEPSALLHGDFRTGNVLAEEDHVTAVIDWEIWSRSDPRIDLAWFLVFVEDERRESPPGTPSVDELLETYVAARGAPVADLDWFRALVRYKQTATGAFITRNARRRGAPVTPVDNSTSWLLTSARQLLG
ncbi:MAG: phosphotransferase, partial [Acidimicrobiia bacterium]